MSKSLLREWTELTDEELASRGRIQRMPAERGSSVRGDKPDQTELHKSDYLSDFERSSKHK